MSKELGSNIFLSITNSEASFKVNLLADLGLSSTGKTNIVAKTSGWKTFEHEGVEYIINCNIMKRKSKS